MAIALSGVAQAVDMVEQLAKSGYLNSQDFETCVRSLFEQNPTDTEAVYGGLARLNRGAETLTSLLSNQHNLNNRNQVMTYCLGILHLQKRLQKRPDMLSVIGERLEKTRHQVDHFGFTHENVIANLAEIYTDTISHFRFRIQVVGEYQYLQQKRVANQVRVLLFAAIRSATLWRQLGGSRWQLILYRGRLLSVAQALHHETKAAAAEI